MLISSNNLSASFFQREMLKLLFMIFIEIFAYYSIANRSSMFDSSKNVIFMPSFPALPVLPDR